MDDAFTPNGIPRIGGDGCYQSGGFSAPSGGGDPPEGTEGSPIGLLLILTQAE